MKTSQQNFQYGNLFITQTIIETKHEILKINDVSRRDGDFDILLSPSDPDYKKAIIRMINEKNGY